MLASDADLMNHKQVFHGKDLKYDCRKCGKYFSSMEEMRSHLQREHKYEGVQIAAARLARMWACAALSPAQQQVQGEWAR